MKRLKQIGSLILLSAMLFSCGSKVPAETDDVTSTTSVDEIVSGTSATTPAETEPPVDPATVDELPELDFNGEDFVISVQDYGGYIGADLFTENLTGEIVNDAIYTKNQIVEDRLNIHFVYDSFTHNWGDRANYISRIRASVMSDDAEYDLLSGLGYFIPGFTAEGLLTEMSDLPYLNMDKVWWNHKFMEEASVDGKYYFVTGDASLSLIKAMFCYFVNLDLYDELDLQDDLYQLVYDGKWTVDKVAEIGASVYADLNGNAQIDSEDRHGLLLYGNNQTTGFLEACDVDIVSRENGEFRFVFGNEHNANVVQRMCKFLHESSGIHYVWQMPSSDKNAETVNESPFRHGNMLMTGGWLTHADSFRDLDFKYGILPYPKFDEAQEEYLTTTLTSYTVFAIPSNCRQPERAAAVLEAMAVESYRSVTPAYFETTLKVKYASDDDTAKMFDLIRENISFDFGYIYTSSMSSISDGFKKEINNNRPDWASAIASVETQMTGLMEFLVKSIRAVE